MNERTRTTCRGGHFRSALGAAQAKRVRPAQRGRCGHRSLRFRPPLDITLAEIDEALAILTKAMEQSQAKSA